MVNTNCATASSLPHAVWRHSNLMALSLAIVLIAGCQSPQLQITPTSKQMLESRLAVAGVKYKHILDADAESGWLCTVDLSETGISDLGPLRGIPINVLVLSGEAIKDLSPLSGMPLVGLVLDDTEVTDLAPLQYCPLQGLAIRGKALKTIAPLKGMRLISLQIDHTDVSDLSPLAGMPLQTLFIHDTEVSDLTPLRGMRLEYFTFSPEMVTNGIDVIRRMKSLKGIGDPQMDPPTEFWQHYDCSQRSSESGYDRRSR